jgi:hypothetical protein
MSFHWGAVGCFDLQDSRSRNVINGATVTSAQPARAMQVGLRYQF